MLDAPCFDFNAGQQCASGYANDTTGDAFSNPNFGECSECANGYGPSTTRNPLVVSGEAPGDLEYPCVPCTCYNGVPVK